MADYVVNAVVSSIVEGILARLGPAAFKEISQITGIRENLKRLEKTLLAISGVLLDAEEQQSTKSVKNWLHNLKEVAYDIEDVLDLISTQDLERRVNETSLHWNKLTRMYSRYSLAREMKAICCRLKDIADNRRNYSFQELRPHPHAIEANTEKETFSSREELPVFGRKHDKDWIVSRLLSSSSHEAHHPRVVPIIGIGGMGKTTLAQLVFDDPRVDDAFELTLWAYISKKFVLKTAIVNIIQAATTENYSHLNMEALQKKLRENLAGHTFLLVLDDVWIEDSKQWLQLRNLLAVGARGSTIMLTTREERVASLTGTIEPYRLKELSEDHSWSIFVSYAFDKGEEDDYPLLMQIGKSIIRKCRGVPLAVITLGSSLRLYRDDRVWKKIDESELWKISQKPNDILSALKLSYDHTPNQLRACFASCSIFVKGYPLHRSNLISLWMAQGLLQCGEGREDAIDVGYRYFNELMSRSFFQLPSCSIPETYAMRLVQDFNWMHGVVNNSGVHKEDTILQGFRSFDGQATCVEMHDLIHDLAAYVAGEETVMVSSNSDDISERVKHLVWDMEDLSGKDFPKGLLKARKAKTIAFLYKIGYISKPFLNTLISNFKCLRVLMFVNSEFEELPDSIGDLKHLRYLDLHGNAELKSLPYSICNLVNLKVLDVGGCRKLDMLPEKAQRLVSLRILWLTFMFTWLPERSHQGWSCLQILKITSCPNLESLSKEFDIGSLKCLKVLVIRVCNGLVDLPDSLVNLTNLEHITIHSCRELDLTGWNGLRNLRSLRVLIVYNLPKLLMFPDIGSASDTLQYLRISNCASLDSLHESLSHCTSLLKLQVFNCPELSLLPQGINGVNTLQELQISGCLDLSSRCKRDGGDAWDVISHIPNIYIDETVIQTRTPSILL